MYWEYMDLNGLTMDMDT